MKSQSRASAISTDKLNIRQRNVVLGEIGLRLHLQLCRLLFNISNQLALCSGSLLIVTHNLGLQLLSQGGVMAAGSGLRATLWVR